MNARLKNKEQFPLVNYAPLLREDSKNLKERI